MKEARYLSWVGIAAIFVYIAGCAEMMGPMAGPRPTITSTTPSTIPQVQAIPWDEKPRVAVMEFENKTGTYYQTTRTGRGYAVGDPIGGGMKEQLVTALHQTGAFIVLERQAVKDVIGEQDFGASGRVRRETAPDIGEIEGAEFLIYGAVTEYTPEQTNVQGGVGLGATGGALLGIPGGALIGGIAEQALAGSMSQHHVAIDIRLVDARTGRVVHADSVEATANDLGGTFGGIFGTTLAGLSGSYQTPMQKAVRACMIKAVNWIAESVKDYRGGRPLTASTKEPGSSSIRKPAGPPRSLVRQIQQDLNTLGHDCGEADGIWGQKTEACIGRFVKDNGISVDGSLRSTAALKAISQELEKRRPPTPVVRTSGARKSPEPPSSGPEDKKDPEDWGQ